MENNMNTFKGANVEFHNQGIHFLCAEIIKFRTQLIIRNIKDSQSGWNDALNAYMIEELERLNTTVVSIAYNPENITKDALEDRAHDINSSLLSTYNDSSLSSDNTLMPDLGPRPIVWDLTGDDPNIPQMTPANCPNDIYRAFITSLDDLFVMSTRLDSRHESITISAAEAVQLQSQLEKLISITQRKGGEANRTDIPNGTLPSDEAATFQGGV